MIPHYHTNADTAIRHTTAASYLSLIGWIKNSNRVSTCKTFVTEIKATVWYFLVTGCDSQVIAKYHVSVFVQCIKSSHQWRMREGKTRQRGTLWYGPVVWIFHFISVRLSHHSSCPMALSIAIATRGFGGSTSPSPSVSPCHRVTLCCRLNYWSTPPNITLLISLLSPSLISVESSRPTPPVVISQPLSSTAFERSVCVGEHAPETLMDSECETMEAESAIILLFAQALSNLLSIS